jgi:sulfide:quinone oxidoreductase
MAKELVIIGAGSGGLILSNTVARQLAEEIRRGEVRVRLLGDKDEYVYQPGFLYVAFDLMRPSELTRKVKDLLVPGVSFIHDRAVRIDPKAQVVETRGGQRLDYDYLVVATGSAINPAEVPGLTEGGHWFYTLEGAIKLREALQTFEGGKLVIAVGVPHKCPVAPLEFVYMFDDWATKKGIRAKTEITYTYPLNGSHTLQCVSDWCTQEFPKRNITLETFFNMDSVDPVAKVITSIEGTTMPYDLLVAIPPHVGADLGKESGLAEGGNWYPTDRYSLQLKGHENVFILGDAGAMPVPKAGSVAHFEAEVLAGNLTNLLTGSHTVHLYDGKAFCFIETGMDAATYLSFDYTHMPAMIPTSQPIHWFKAAYNRIHWMNLKGIV